MDEVTFRMDTVLSDVHLLLPNARHLMTRLNGVGQPGSRTALSPFLAIDIILANEMWSQTLLSELLWTYVDPW